MGKKKSNANSLTRYQNNLLSNDNDDEQQYLLQTLFSVKRLKIILIGGKKNISNIKQVVWANLKDDYCFKLRCLPKIGF